MPRNGSGVYQLPGTYEAVSGETIQAQQHNDPLEDLQGDANVARPVVAGGTGATTAADARTNLGVPGLASNNTFSGIDTFSKIQKWAKGADVASASALTLGDDGNYFDITGTTAITSIATKGVGTVVRLHFDAALTLTHNATTLILPGAGDITTAAGDEAEFIEYATGDWRCVEYSRAANAPDIIRNIVGSLLQYGSIINGTISESHSSNAATFSLKTLAGNDPTASDPVFVAFRNSTAGTGNYVFRKITSATSLTISSGSKLGAIDATAFRIWLVLFDDAGTIRLGAINCLDGINIFPLGKTPLASSTAEGGAGAADSAHVFFTGAAVTSKPYVVLGYATYESGLTTAGTWDASPSAIQLYGHGVPLPGEAIQEQINFDGAVATGTTTIPKDDTVPQNTEGTQFMSQAITPTSAANILDVAHEGEWNGNGSGGIVLALFKESDASAIGAFVCVTQEGQISIRHRRLARTTSAITFKIRVGQGTSGTITFNGTAGSREMGGVMSSYLGAKEIMA
jgi:hypothetical protein